MSSNDCKDGACTIRESNKKKKEELETKGFVTDGDYDSVKNFD